MDDPPRMLYNGAISYDLITAFYPWNKGQQPWGVLLIILERGVPPGLPNPDPVLDPNITFSTPVF